MSKKQRLDDDELHCITEESEDEISSTSLGESSDELCECNLESEENGSCESISVESWSDEDDDDDVSTTENSTSFSENNAPDQVLWSTPQNSFMPRLNCTDDCPTVSLCNVSGSSDELEYFLQVFPRSLIIFISQCTNEHLQLLREQKKASEIPDTDPGEVMLVLGCILVMSYNRLPNISHYWSHNSSVGNEAIKSAIARNRYQSLLSKLYFNKPRQPADASKTYYIDEVVSCLRYTFQKAREESPFQSIHESMTKFKGRSSLKQYLPLKPVKRGIKIWERCDSVTGYTYDLSVYSGKPAEVVNSQQKTTLGDQVVLNLSKTIRNPDVTLTFDRFFTSVHLLNTLPFPAVGTCILSRKDMPKFQGKLKRGEFQFVANQKGTLAARWQDSKEVTVMSNCHDCSVEKTNRKQKNGNTVSVDCPSLICSYNRFMCGVDLSDQKVNVYEFDRKSRKWWKKVFYKLLMVAVVNAWILYNETSRNKTKLLQFVVPLAEKMIATGKQNSKVKRKRGRGRPSNIAKRMINVGDHLPVEGTTRRRCSRCSKNKIETRTKTLCTMCNVPLCKNCFTPYHTLKL